MLLKSCICVIEQVKDLIVY